MISEDDLPKEIVPLGLLAGLLMRDGGGLKVNEAWFGNPVVGDPGLGNADRRLRFVGDLASLVFPSIDKPPPLFATAKWYRLDKNSGKTCRFALVDSGAMAGNGVSELGLSVLHQMSIGSADVSAFIYLPTIDYSDSGASFVVAKAPLRIGVAITGLFCAGDISFTSMTLQSSIYFADTAPECALVFRDAEGEIGRFTPANIFSDPRAASWLSAVIVQAGRTWLDTNIGDYWVSPGGILAAAGLLTRDENGNYGTNFDNLAKRSAIEIVKDLVLGALVAFTEGDSPVAFFEFFGGGLFGVRRENKDGTTVFGLRLQMEVRTDADGEKTASDAARESTPKIAFCLGSPLSAEREGPSWIRKISGTTCEDGVTVHLVTSSMAGDISFTPSFEFVNVGFDLQGQGEQPLFDVGGYSIRGFELRTYLDSISWAFGVALALDRVGIPVGPDFKDTKSGGNAIAKNIISSDDTGGEKTDKTAVAPAFSAIAAHIHDAAHPYSPSFEIFDPSGKKTDSIWLPIQRRFGPIGCRKIGLKLSLAGDPVLGILFDGNVSLGVIEVELDQLAIGMPLNSIADPTTYDIDLQGLDIKCKAGEVGISGGLLRRTGGDGTISYDGEASVTLTKLSICALGSYCSLPDGQGTSLFVFAMLDDPLGGRPSAS